MPSTTAYSQYETLTLFQSIARYGSDASTFRDISTALIQNQFIDSNGSDSKERLSAEALRRLYEEAVRIERNREATRINGTFQDGERSPKRRKLSGSPQPDHDSAEGDHQHVVALADRLYNRYKEETIKEIRRHEEAYAKLQEEVQSLEAEVNAGQSAVKSSPAPSVVERLKDSKSKDAPGVEIDGPNGSSSNATSVSQIQHGPTVSNLDNKHIATEDDDAVKHKSANGIPVPRSQNGQPSTSNTPTESSSHSSHQTTKPSQLSSDGSHRQPGPRSPQTHHGATPVPVGYVSGPPYGTQTPYTGPYQRQASNPAPVPLPAQNYPYPPYGQYPPQWHPQLAHQQYQQHQGHPMSTLPLQPPPQQYYPPQMHVPGRHPQTPQQVPYQPYPHTAPVQHAQAQSWQENRFSPRSASAVSTPVAKSNSRSLSSQSGSTTPWRRKGQSGQLRQISPTRPERDISPLGDEDTLAPDTAVHKPHHDLEKSRAKIDEETPIRTTRPGRRGRPPSKTPSAMAPSRSQSAASHASDTANEKSTTTRRGQRIKVEPPSTPLPPPSDSDTQRSSGRRGRPRKGTVTSHTELGRSLTTKRKRESPSPSPSIRSPIDEATIVRADEDGEADSEVKSFHHDPSLVIVSKNFSKTSQLLLNEITSHKLAGIFAKPLSERDAPGYKDLVQRPQDLKSVKAAISRGNRAALAAIDAVDTEIDDSETASSEGQNMGSSPGSLGNGFYLVPKTEDLVPPKGIVNGAQLEMELIRMFANAIMFNPLPSSERGFGRHLRLRKNGGDSDPTRNRTRIADSEDPDPEENEGSEDDSTVTSGGTGWDEGGIIADTREMFEDVMEMVRKWRSLEHERMGISGSSSQRHHNNSEPSRAVNTTSSSGGGPTNSGHLDVSTGRHNSVSASSNINDEEGDGESTPIPTTTASTGNNSNIAGSTRKRRRIAEH